MINRSHLESSIWATFREMVASRCAAVGLLLTVMATFAAPGCAGTTAAPVMLDAPRDATRQMVVQMAGQMALSAMDREALFTIAPTDDGTRMKALSTGFWQSKLDAAAPAGEVLREVESRRRALDLLDSYDLDFGVMAFATVFDGQRHVEAYVVHIPTMDDVLSRHASFFGPYALTPGTSVGEVLATVERMPRLDRFRAYGLLFGYPQYAVDFFVEAAGEEVNDEGKQETKAEAKDAGKPSEPKARRPIVPRDFVSIPVHESDTNRFVWAAPKGHAGHPDDDAIRLQAATILERYREEMGEPPLDGIDLLRTMQASPRR